MKVKAVSILFSLIATLLLLFGGWFTFQKFYIEDPIKQFIANKSNVVLKDFAVNSNEVTVDVDFKDPTTFASDYKEINDYIHVKSPSKKVTINLPQEGAGLKNVWNEQYFNLAQALDHKEYGQIPQLAQDMKKNGKLDQSIARMDDQNIYLYMQEGKDHMYAVLPLKEEVNKSNE